MLPSAPRILRRSLRSAAILGAALLLLPTTPAAAQSLPMSGVWSGITALTVDTSWLKPEVTAEAPDTPKPVTDAISPLLEIEPLPESWHAPQQLSAVQERSGGVGMEWSVNRRWSVGLTYRRGFENVQLDPTAERRRGTLGGIPVDDRLATQCLLIEFRLNF